MNKNNGRFTAIFLAILVPAGFWLGMAYLNRPVASAPEVEPAPPSARKGPPAEPARQEEEPALPQSLAQATDPAPGGIYKCQHNGSVTYTDKPELQCDKGAQATRMVPVAANAGIAPAKPYQQQLAELEREQARNINPAEDQARQAQRDRDRTTHEQLCRDLADEITRIDSTLRQPHDAHAGDYWTAQRRSATDRRYSEHC